MGFRRLLTGTYSRPLSRLIKKTTFFLHAEITVAVSAYTRTCNLTQRIPTRLVAQRPYLRLISQGNGETLLIYILVVHSIGSMPQPVTMYG